MMALLIIVKKLLKKLHKMIHVFAFSMLKMGELEKPLTWVFQKQKVSILLNLKVTIM